MKGTIIIPCKIMNIGALLRLGWGYLILTFSGSMDVDLRNFLNNVEGRTTGLSLSLIIDKCFTSKVTKPEPPTCAFIHINICNSEQFLIFEELCWQDWF